MGSSPVKVSGLAVRTVELRRRGVIRRARCVPAVGAGQARVRPTPVSGVGHEPRRGGVMVRERYDLKPDAMTDAERREFRRFEAGFVFETMPWPPVGPDGAPLD